MRKLTSESVLFASNTIYLGGESSFDKFANLAKVSVVTAATSSILENEWVTTIGYTSIGQALRYHPNEESLIMASFCEYAGSTSGYLILLNKVELVFGDVVWAMSFETDFNKPYS